MAHREALGATQGASCAIQPPMPVERLDFNTTSGICQIRRSSVMRIRILRCSSDSRSAANVSLRRANSASSFRILRSRSASNMPAYSLISSSVSAYRSLAAAALRLALSARDSSCETLSFTTIISQVPSRQRRYPDPVDNALCGLVRPRSIYETTSSWASARVALSSRMARRATSRSTSSALRNSASDASCAFNPSIASPASSISAVSCSFSPVKPFIFDCKASAFASLSSTRS